MVQDVYSKTGEYVDFLKTYCAVGPPNDGCKEHKAVPSLVKTEKDLVKLNVNQVRKRLLQQWGSFWDSSSTIRLEKTPEVTFSRLVHMICIIYTFTHHLLYLILMCFMT